GVRLVVLAPQHPHSKGTPDSPARQWVAQALHQRGSSPRYHKNTLLFLAPDKAKLENLERSTAQYLAWQAIVAEKEALNLDVFQSNQATTKLKQSSQEVENLLRDTYQWLLIPNQPNAQGNIEWKETRLQEQDSPILKASRKVTSDGDLLPAYSAANLRLEALDKFLWRDTNHLDLKRLWEYLTQYLYLPRLKDQSVLLQAVRDGVARTDWADNFAYAEGFNETTGKYLGLQAGTGINPSISPQSLLVKPGVAQKQLNEEGKEVKEEKKGVREKNEKYTANPTPAPSSSILTPPLYRRFYGNVAIDPVRINRDAATIANEVIQHLTALSGAKITVTLEIEAEIPEGVPEDVVRTVMENCRTLKFNTQSFEQS
ncbi:MAG: AAA+ family ATPase, partial [Pseudanabaenaceae cyanobacterium]